MSIKDHSTDSSHSRSDTEQIIRSVHPAHCKYRLPDTEFRHFFKMKKSENIQLNWPDHQICTNLESRFLLTTKIEIKNRSSSPARVWDQDGELTESVVTAELKDTIIYRQSYPFKSGDIMLTVGCEPAQYYRWAFGHERNFSSSR